MQSDADELTDDTENTSYEITTNSSSNAAQTLTDRLEDGPKNTTTVAAAAIQSNVDELTDDLGNVSFESTTTTSTIASTTPTTVWAASSLTSSSTKPHALPGDPCWDAIRRVNSVADALRLEDLVFLRRLGSGDIGRVYLVELKCAEGCFFAAKVMDKDELACRSKEGRAMIEREILELLDHPFLPTLYATLDSPRLSCLLTEFCPGGDLHVLRQEQPDRRFNHDAVRFYASEVIAALEYLHMMGIIYRDLKPENILVRSDGHIMLTDFDLSLKCDNSSSTHLVSNQKTPNRRHNNPLQTSLTKSSCRLSNCIMPRVTCFRRRQKPLRRRHNNRGYIEIVSEPTDARSMSFVGTHEYLAPEIISGEGHGNAVDWWTLGIFIFELCYGVTPFKGNHNEHTLANVVARALQFPTDPPISGAMKDLITQLLIKDPTKRLGSTVGAIAIRHHPVFDGVNWALLRCEAPPFLPLPRPYRNFTLKDNSPHDVSVEFY